MRLDAHPLIVAVALGLLGPAALAEDEEPVAAEAEGATAPGITPAVDTCVDAPEGCADER